ncbi:MAG: hypothetical protein ABI740_02920 [Alphaproteobacteria bacterium]
MAAASARRIVERELQPDEILVWQGQPGRTRMMGFAGMAGVVFMVIWTGAAIVWTGFALDQGWFMDPFTDDFIDRWMWLAGLPFIFAGMGGLYWQARRLWLTFATTYTLTNQRILIAEGSKTYTFRAPDLAYIRRTGTDRRGTLSFATGAIETGAKPGAMFLNIEKPAQVETLIRSTLLTHA